MWALLLSLALGRWFDAVSDRPFSRHTIRQAERMLREPEFRLMQTADAVRIEGRDCGVELGAIHSGAPRKLTLRCSFATRNEAVEFIRALAMDLPQPVDPRLQMDGDGALVRDGTYVWRRQAVGVEAHLLPDDGRWNAALILIEGGPRIVIPWRP